MNIALYHNLPSGGARRAVYEMVKRLAARGHTVDEFCPQTADVAFLPLDQYVRHTIVLPFQTRGVLTRRIPLLTPYANALRLSLDLGAVAKLGEHVAHTIDDGGYDVVFAHDCQLAQNPDVLRFLATPSVYYCHHGARSRLPRQVDPVSGLLQRAKSVYYALPRKVYPWLRERRATENIRRADQVVTNSYFAREGLFRAYGIDSHVCYLGVDTDRFRPLPIERQAFVLSVGAVHPWKGYCFLLRSLARVPAASRPALMIAANSADPQERAVIEDLARDLEVDLTIRRTTDDAALVQLYNRAAALAYTPIMEPLGLVALEAMACGTPVVAVREGGVRETVVHGETGLLVNRDEDAFATALRHVLTDPRRAHELARSAAESVRANWTWERTVDQLEREFVTACEGQGSG